VDTNVGAASSRPDFAAEDPANFTLVGYATDGQTLLTMKTRELRAFGFTDPAFNIDDDQDLKTFFGAQNLARLDQTWSENLVGFMTQGMSGIIIRGLLIVVFLLAMFIEMSAPGVGVAGAIGLAALGGIIIPPLLVGASTWWALAAILLGFALILLEVLVIPGFGVPGLAGLAALMVGLVGSFAGTGEIFPGAGGSGGSSLAWAVSTVILATFAAGTAMYFVSKYTRSIPIANRLVLADVQKASPPVGEADSGTLLGAMAGAPVGPVAVGDVGITTTRLIPAGSAEFGGRLLDVVSELGYVEPGTRIRVVNVTEYRIGVEPMSEDGAAEAGGPPETHA
jgi:membrane-bound serine protease (ClpP class)